MHGRVSPVSRKPNRRNANHLTTVLFPDLAGPDVVIDEGPKLPPLPAAVDVAAYRIATEAITNAIRHAGARHCRVRIVANTVLEIEVTDDGHGWVDRLIPGVGTQSMRERAADLGL